MSTASSLPSPTLSTPSNPPTRQLITQAQRTAEAKAAFTASLKSVGASLDSDLQSRAQDIHKNAKVLEQQQRDLKKDAANLKKQNAEMERFVKRVDGEGGGRSGWGIWGGGKNDKGLREFDDLEDILKRVEGSLEMLEETMDRAEGKGEFESEDEWEDEAEGDERRDEDEKDKTEAKLVTSTHVDELNALGHLTLEPVDEDNMAGPSTSRHTKAPIGSEKGLLPRQESGETG